MATVLSARSVLAAAGDALLVERRQLDLDELTALSELPSESTPSLAALAHEVRLSWCGPEVEIEGILSAKTGGCPEDCHFCSQSAKFDSPGEGHAVPRLRRDPRRGRGDGRARRQRVLHRAGRARAEPDRHGPARTHRTPGAGAHRPERRGVRRHPDPQAGRAARRRGRASLQPQPRDGAFVLRRDRHDAHVGGAIRDVSARA